MRLLAAALYVYIGLIVSGLLIMSWTKEQDWPPYVGMILLGVVIVFLVWSAKRIFERRPARDAAPGRSARCYGAAGEPVWVFHFIDGQRERLRAERAERRQRTGMNGVCRGLTVFLGFMWIAGALAAAYQGETGWQQGLAIVAGLAVWHGFVVKPALAEWDIRHNMPDQEAIELHVRPNGVRVIAGDEAVHRPWDDLAEVVPTAEGLIFYWHDGTKGWLPASAIGNEGDVEELLTFIAANGDTDDDV